MQFQTVSRLIKVADCAQDVIHNSSGTADVDLEQIASQAAGMLPSDLMAISADAASSAALQVLGTEMSAILDGKGGSPEAHSQSKTPAEGLRLTSEHYETGLQNLRQRTAAAIGAPQVRWCMADIGSSFPYTFSSLSARPPLPLVAPLLCMMSRQHQHVLGNPS